MPATRGGGFAEQRLPGGDVVGEAGDGLEFGGFKGGAGDLRLGGELRGVEEAAEGDGDLLVEKQAQFAGELMLAGDPCLVGGGAESRGWLRGRRGTRRSRQRNASSGSHSRAAMSAFSTGDGMGSSRGMFSI